MERDRDRIGEERKRGDVSDKFYNISTYDTFFHKLKCCKMSLLCKLFYM